MKMIPEGTDIPALSAQLSEDGVAFSNPELANNQEVQAPIKAALEDSHGIAVVDVHPQRLADTRDIAQELQDATGLDTVIVQTTRSVSAVSDTYSRAAIESAQTALPQGIDQVTLLDQFYSGVDPLGAPWPIIVVAVLLLAAASAAVAFKSATRK
ncbi:Rv1476 family membrane protein [Corynebacterium casei]|uniref:Rv1476 family membrane protein n=2 Tax=Corynebacterium casei TaxID=160386 RepID=UPI003F9D79B6